MIRLLDTIGYLLFLTILMIILIHYPARGQPLPTNTEQHDDFYFPNDIAERFYDTKILPDGNEVSQYLFRNEPARVFFLVEENNRPVYILIKPCASKVEWTVTHRSTSISDHDEDHSDEPFLPQREMLVKPTTSTGTFIQQFNETSETSVFSQSRGEKGLYTVEITSLESDSYVRILGTTTPDFTYVYPTLPTDIQVQPTVVKRRSFGVTWKTSADETPFGNLIEYCVSVNRKRFYDTHCGLMSHMNGDPKPSRPKHSGFFWNWEKEDFKSQRKKAKPVKAQKNIFHKCVGSNTRFIFTRARPGRKYFVNVYVRNKNTNGTSAYRGIEIKTKKGRSQARLKDGKTQQIQLKKPREKSVFKYRLRKDTNELFLAIHSCSGRVKLQVFQSGKEILKMKVRNVKVHTLKNLKRGQYVFRVTNSRRGRRNVRLLVTTNPEKFRYPRLPKDTRIIIVDNYTTCSNITIAFLGTEKRQTYCLFMKEITTLTRKRKKRLRYDQCLTSKEGSNEIICLNYRHQDKKSVLTHTISGLKPGTSYEFDVSVKLKGRFSLAYQSKRAQTNSEC